MYFCFDLFRDNYRNPITKFQPRFLPEDEFEYLRVVIFYPPYHWPQNYSNVIKCFCSLCSKTTGPGSPYIMSLGNKWGSSLETGRLRVRDTGCGLIRYVYFPI